MHYGENGILKGAETAVDKYQNKAEQEQNELAKIDDYIQNSRENVTITKDEYEALIEKTKTNIENFSATDFWKTTTDYTDINDNIKVIKTGNLIEFELIVGSVERGSKKNLPNGIEVQVGVLNEEFCPELDRVIEYGIDGGDINRATFAVYKDGRVTVKNNRGSQSAAIGHFIYYVK